jgi:hypothetical protein
VPGRAVDRCRRLLPARSCRLRPAGAGQRRAGQPCRRAPADPSAPEPRKVAEPARPDRGAPGILEIGTLGGYSTTWPARALPDDGRLVTLESDPHRAAVAAADIARAGLDHVVDIRIVGDGVVREGAVTDAGSDGPHVQ